MGKSNTVGSKYYQARLILADGTDKVVDVEKKDGNDVALDSADFTKYSNTLCTYDVSKDVYTITPVGETTVTTSTGSKTYKEYAGYENLISTAKAKIDGSVTGTFTVKGAETSVSKAYLDDTAVVFVKYKTDDYKVVTGKTAKGWKKTTDVGFTALTKKDSNAQYAGVAFVNLGSDNTPGGSDKTYAVVLDSTWTDKISGTTYTMVPAWNGSEEVTYKYEGTINLVKGDIFEYSADGEDTVDITKHAGTTTKVATYDAGSGEITFADGTIVNKDSEAYKIDSKDTTILYVDSSKNKGYTDGEIQLAPKYNGDTTNNDDNVTVYVEDGENENITVIVVDVKNKIDW